MNRHHPSCTTGFAPGDRVRLKDGTTDGTVVDEHFHVFDDPAFRPRLVIEWEGGGFTGSFLPDDVVKLGDAELRKTA